MSGRGRGRGRGGRGRAGGRGKRSKRKKPTPSAARRTEDDDASIELVVPPSRPSLPSSSSSTDGETKRTYRKFDDDDAAFRNTLLERAARDRIKAMQDNQKNPGRLPRGFGSSQVEAFRQKVPNLRITESDIDNRRRLIEKKRQADAQEGTSCRKQAPRPNSGNRTSASTASNRSSSGYAPRPSTARNRSSSGHASRPSAPSATSSTVSAFQGSAQAQPRQGQEGS